MYGTVTGVVTAKKQGETTITAKVKDGSGEYDTCYVTVTEAAKVTGISLSILGGNRHCKLPRLPGLHAYIAVRKFDPVHILLHGDGTGRLCCSSLYREDSAFVNCTSLAKITIPRKTTSIASNAFSLKNVLLLITVILSGNTISSSPLQP